MPLSSAEERAYLLSNSQRWSQASFSLRPILEVRGYATRLPEHDLLRIPADASEEEEMTIEDVERLQIILALKKRELARKKRRGKGHTRGHSVKPSSSKVLGITKTKSSKELTNSAKALALQLEQEMEGFFVQNACLVHVSCCSCCFPHTE